MQVMQRGNGIHQIEIVIRIGQFRCVPHLQPITDFFLGVGDLAPHRVLLRAVDRAHRAGAEAGEDGVAALERAAHHGIGALALRHRGNGAGGVLGGDEEGPIPRTLHEIQVIVRRPTFRAHDTHRLWGRVVGPPPRRDDAHLGPRYRAATTDAQPENEEIRTDTTTRGRMVRRVNARGGAGRCGDRRPR